MSKTIGDGNCFFHAVFGNERSGVYQTENAAKMREEWYKFLSQYEFSGSPDRKGKPMPKDLQDRLERVFDNFLNSLVSPPSPPGADNTSSLGTSEKNDKLKQLKKKIITTKLSEEIVEKYLQDEELKKKIQKVISNDPDFKQGLQDKSILVKLVSNNLKDCAEEYGITSEKFKNLDDSRISARILGSDPDFYKLYLEAIQSSRYYVMVEEAPILASLAKINITIDSVDGAIKPNKELLGGYQTDSTILGNKKEETIYHSGIHFRREEKEEEDTSSSHAPQHAATREFVTPDISEDIIPKKHVSEFFIIMFGMSKSREASSTVMIDDSKGNHKVTIQKTDFTSDSSNITPLLFLEAALKSQMKSCSALATKNCTIGNFINYMLVTLNRKGACLTSEEYNNNSKDFIKVITTKDNIETTTYLVPNNSEEGRKEEYAVQFPKYARHILEGWKKIMLDNSYPLDDSCEVMAKLALLLVTFGGNKDSYFFTEDDSILYKEIRLYRTQKGAKEGNTDTDDEISMSKLYSSKGSKFSKLSCKEIVDVEECYYGGRYPFIRLKDVKKDEIQKATTALEIIDGLLKQCSTKTILNQNELIQNYNNSYNSEINVFTGSSNVSPNYTKALTTEIPILQHHAAKHVYKIFDLRSSEGSEERIFAPKIAEDIEEDIITVWSTDNDDELTSTDKHLLKEYSLQDSPDIDTELLMKQAVEHCCLTLSPFSSLNSSAPSIEDSPIRQILNAFGNLLILDHGLGDSSKTTFDTEVTNKLNENLELSGCSYQQYDC